MDLTSSVIAIHVMDDICQWLRANDVTPGHVPIWAVPRISDGRMTMPVYLMRDGKKYIGDDGEIAFGSIDVPLLEEPPTVLSQWLASEEG